MPAPRSNDALLDLIRKSARQASARLQFARLAFGAAGSAGASIDLGDAEQVAHGLFQDDKITLTWSASRALLPKNKVKLLLNLLVTAMSAIPRGGAISVAVTGVAGMRPGYLCGWLQRSAFGERPTEKSNRKANARNALATPASEIAKSGGSWLSNLRSQGTAQAVP